MKTNSHISKINQFVCQNQVVFSQSPPVITSFPELVNILVSNRTIQRTNPTIIPTSPDLGEIFLEKIPNAKTATIAGANKD